MRGKSSTFAAVRFIDRDRVIEDLRRIAAQARAGRPEILKVLLFGSLTQENWTADSDADLIVVVRREFADLFARSRYQIHSPSIPTDTLVYSEAEFETLARDPQSFLAQLLPSALDLLAAARPGGQESRSPRE